MGRTACTEPQYSYTSARPMGRMACTEPQYSYTSTPPMCRTACTEPQYSYTSTSPMGHTACTETQCLYKGALYLYLTPLAFILATPESPVASRIAQNNWHIERKRTAGYCGDVSWPKTNSDTENTCTVLWIIRVRIIRAWYILLMTNDEGGK